MCMYMYTYIYIYIYIYILWICNIFCVELILDRRYLKHIHKRGGKKVTNSRLLQPILVNNLNNVDSLNINHKVFQITEKVRLYLISIRSKIVSARVMYQCRAFAKYLYLVGYPNRLLLVHSHRTLLWRFNVSGKKIRRTRTYVFLSRVRF